LGRIKVNRKEAVVVQVKGMKEGERKDRTTSQLLEELPIKNRLLSVTSSSGFICSSPNSLWSLLL
jgi:hypothetical protein